MSEIHTFLLIRVQRYLIKEGNSPTMVGRRPVLLTLFVLLNYCKECQSTFLIRFDWGEYGPHTIRFDDYAFQKFFECLCNVHTYKCTSSLLKNYYDAGNTESEEFQASQNTQLYSNNYVCGWDLLSGLYGEVICRRLGHSISLEPPTQSNPCQTVHTRNMSPKCSLGCINVVWNYRKPVGNITGTNTVNCGLCESSSFTVTSVTTTTAIPTTIATPTFDGKKDGDSSDDEIPLIVGVVVAVVVVLVITVIIIVFWWRRKRNSKLPSTSHQYTSSTGSVSQNYENTRHGQEHVNGNGRPATNPYVIDDSDSINATSPYQQAGQTVVDSYVSPVEVIQKKRAAAAKNSNTGNQGTEYSSIDQDVPDAVISPVNEPQNNNDTRSAPNPSSVTPVSTTYSRLGEPVRNIQNPYNALQNPDEYSVAKSTPGNNNMSAQYSFAGPATSPLSSQDSEIVHNSTPQSQPTNRNTYGYEEVGVNNMTAPVVSNDYEESPTQASGDNKDGAEAPKEPDYTNFPVKEPVAAKNEYAKLGEPMRNIQNPYDVMVNQEEDGPEESTSQAPPTLADDPYSLARPT